MKIKILNFKFTKVCGQNADRIALGWVRRELKHLSNARKINHMRFP